jgi:ferredoxin
VTKCPVYFAGATMQREIVRIAARTGIESNSPKRSDVMSSATDKGNKERRLKCHRAICECKTCKGEINKAKLCPPCKVLDDLADGLKGGVAK